MNDFPRPSQPSDVSDGDHATIPVSMLPHPGWSYEATVSEIESIINRIEMGELDLAEVFDQFAIAVEHLRHCENFLNHQQQQMDLMIETLLDESEPF